MKQPTDRLLSQLNQTQLAQKDNPTYQVIKQLIQRIKDLESLISGGDTTNITNITQIIQQFGMDDSGGGDEGGTVPGTKGDKGDIGNAGPTGPPFPAFIYLEADDPEQLLPIPIKGDKGDTGSAGPTGPQSIGFVLQGEDAEDSLFIPGPVGPPGAGSLTFLKTTIQQIINAGAGVYTDITGLTFPVLNGNTYGFKFYIVFQSANTGTGQKASVNCPTGTLDFFSTHQTVANSATVGVNTWLHRHSVTRDDMTVLGSTITAGVDLVVIIEGRYICTADGIFAARFANELANTDITVEAGSWGYYWIQ